MESGWGVTPRFSFWTVLTRGIDVGVKQSMYQMMYQMKKQGKTIIMISEEMSELMGMSDRLIIMKDGHITKEFARSADLERPRDHQIHDLRGG